MKILRHSLGFVFHFVLPLVVLGSAVTAVMMLGAEKKAGRKKTPPSASVSVDIVHPREHTGTLSISANGVVVPFREVDLASEVDGRVTWKSESLLPGRFVNKGDELLKIDPEDYKLEVDLRKQQLEKAVHDLNKSQVEIENAKRFIQIANETVSIRERDLKRSKALRQRQVVGDSEIDSVEKSLLDAKQSLTTHENQLRSLEAEVQSLKVDKQLATIALEKAKLDLDRTVVKAPFSGVVIENMVEANSYVQTGARIARIEDTSNVEVQCSLRKEDLDFLPSTNSSFETTADAYQLPQLPVTIRYSRANKVYSWNGVLSRQDGLGIDERTRTMPVRILVTNPLESRVKHGSADATPIPLVRGMFVSVELHCTLDQPLLAVPTESIRAGKTIWLIENDKLAVSPVDIARIEDGIAYLDSRNGQLSSQHSVISSPVPGAKEGLAVTTKSSTRSHRSGGKRKVNTDRKPRRDPASTADSGQQKRKTNSSPLAQNARSEP